MIDFERSQTARQTDVYIQDLLKKKNFTEAEAALRTKLREEPENPDIYFLFAALFYMRGQLGSAIDHLKKALTLDPKHTDAAICLSVIYNDVGKYDEAKQVFEQANQSVAHRRPGDASHIDRKFAVKHLELADLYFRYRRYDEAIEEYGQAIALDSTALDVRIKRAKAYAKKGFISRAIQELQTLKTEHPQFLPSLVQLGLLHYSQGNLLDAELEWESVLEKDPSHKESRAYLDMINEAF